MKGIIKSDKEPAKLSKWKIRGITALMAGVVFLFVGCGDKTPQKPVDPINPNPPIVDIDPGENKEKEALEKAIGEYNSIVTKIENADSLTARVIGNTKPETIKIDDNKLEMSDKIYETSSDKTFVYSQNQKGWQKDFSDGENTSSKMHATIIDTLKSVEWSSVAGTGNSKVLTGTLQVGDISQNRAIITGSYNLEESTIKLTLPDQSVEIYDLDNTQITLPTQYKDNTQQEVNPPAPEFKVEENIELLMQKLQPTLELLNRRAPGGTLATKLKEVKRVYLTKSEGSNIIDSVGAVYTATEYGSEMLFLAELKLPVTKDLNYEDICKNGLTYEPSETRATTKYTMTTNRTQETANKANAEIVLNQMFGQKYTNSDWSCWKYTTGKQGDSHIIAILNGNKIEEQFLSIFHDYNVGINSYIETNFKGQQPSNSTYKINETKIVDIQADALNVQKLLEQAQEKEQSL